MSFLLVLRIPLKNPYYANYFYVFDTVNANKTNFYEDSKIRLKVVNDAFGNMEKDKWYLLPQAYTIELIPL